MKSLVSTGIKIEKAQSYSENSKLSECQFYIKKSTIE